jgi:hypothetical protein
MTSAPGVSRSHRTPLARSMMLRQSPRYHREVSQLMFHK